MTRRQLALDVLLGALAIVLVVWIGAILLVLMGYIH